MQRVEETALVPLNYLVFPAFMVVNQGQLGTNRVPAEEVTLGVFLDSESRLRGVYGPG